MEPIFKTSILWEKIFLYPTHLIYKTGILGKETSISLNQIASIDSGIPTVGLITLETTGGKKIKLTVKPKDKQELIDLIYSNKAKN